MVKRLIIFLFFTFLSQIIFCQICKDRDSVWLLSKVYDGLPGFSDKTLDDFIHENLCYPETAKLDSLEGVIYIRFIIEKDGTTTNHEVIKGIREDLNEEALRVTELIKFDIPATNRGHPVKVLYSIKIAFFLSDIQKTCKIKSTKTKVSCLEKS